MSKPIPTAFVNYFRNFFENRLAENPESPTVYTTIEDIQFSDELERLWGPDGAGFEEWEIAPPDDDHYDFLELFELLPEFVFEEEGGPAWYVSHSQPTTTFESRAMRPSFNRDLSQQTGNPTNAIQQQYHQLMSIQDPEELRDATLQLIQPLVGKGMSDKNYQTFAKRLTMRAQQGIYAVQKCISDFLLAGSGMAVGGSGRGMREGVDVQAIANIITEDADIFRDLTPEQLAIKNLIESEGFTVAFCG